VKSHILVSILVFLFVLIATSTGIFYQTPGAPFEYTTVRGEQAIAQGSGLYRYDPAWFAREGVVWDWINLLIGLPLLAGAIYLSVKDSLRGRLLLGGLLFYFFYVYLMATTGYAFNRLFLVYVVIFALSGVAFFLNLHSMDVPRLPERVSSRFPRRLFIAFTFVMGILLIFLWCGRILPIMAQDRLPPELAGLNTLVSHGIDLGLVVPLLFATGILLWRRSPWGYLLAGVSLSYGLMMCISLPAFIAVPLIQDGKINLFEASPLIILCIIGLVLSAIFYRNVREEGTSRPLTIQEHLQ
jgi:hypothetical protein